jgi:hypothetical protein
VAEEQVEDLGIEVRAAAVAQDLAGLLVGEGFLVRALARERVVRRWSGCCRRISLAGR